MSDSLPLLKPDLYAAGVPTPTLRGGRCECGHLFFPMQTFGCECCGRFGTSLQSIALAGRGQVRSAATVHLHADEKRKTPFVIGTIALDDGPIVRTLLLDVPSDREALGTRVEAVLIPVTTSDPSQDALDLRFRAVRA
jgi:uncharacterized OB-fold protein